MEIRWGGGGERHCRGAHEICSMSSTISRGNPGEEVKKIEVDDDGVMAGARAF